MTSSEHAQLLHCAQTNSALRTLMDEHEAMAAELVKLRSAFAALADRMGNDCDCGSWANDIDDILKLERACKEAK